MASRALDPLLVGLDVGTTSVKAVVFTAAGRQVAVGRAPTPWVTIPLGPGAPVATGTEMDALALADAARSALAQALDAAPPGEVAGLGVTGMGESGVLLDATGRPVAPIIAWHDDRDLREVDLLASEVGADRLAEVAGLPLRRQWTLTKHRWQLRHQPEARSAVRRLNVGEWVVRVLGGQEAADVSLASRTGWLDLARRTWWDEALAFSGTTADLMPELVTSGTPLGRAGDDVPRLAGAVLTTAGHDHQAAALGAGAAGPGDVLDSCGTAEALVRTVPAGLGVDQVRALALAGTTVGWHVLPERWCLLAATEGGLAMGRALEALGVDRDGLPALDAAATDGSAEGRAWADAVDAATADAAALLEAMDRVAGPRRDLVVTGGWARSAAVVAAKRRHLGAFRLPSERGGTEDEEAGARGAALLAARAAGIAGDTDGLPVWPA